MQVLKLFRKPAAKQPLIECVSLNLRQGWGIVGDCHACVGSPRQILLTDRVSLQAFGLQPGDLQENIWVDADLSSLTSGTVLQIGSAWIRLTILCEPCAYLHQFGTGLAKRIRGKRGYLGRAVRDGSIRVGDTATLIPDQFPAIPQDTPGRFYDFVARIPMGKVVSTTDVLLALGMTKAYCRVLPQLMKRAPKEIPVHRVIARDRCLFSQHLPEQANFLRQEGIGLEAGKVVELYNWQAKFFYRENVKI
ncbi:MAG: MGMT family protein [Scytolyngbya sp. HA4215-MV1]|jgi:alkylated DNA nucleotide flippase Atl1|nr:MGMT family protein [Scytolyngbya sp. HA4215-MV1]